MEFVNNYFHAKTPGRQEITVKSCCRGKVYTEARRPEKINALLLRSRIPYNYFGFNSLCALVLFFSVVSVVSVVMLSPVEAADTVVATINGKPVTRDEILRSIDGADEARRMVMADTQDRRQFVERYLSWKLLIDEARRRRLDESPDFRTRLDDQINTLLLNMLSEELRSKIRVTDADAKKFYEQNRAMFEEPETRRPRHILVYDKKLAVDLIARVRNGEPMDTLALQHTQDEMTRPFGGDVGYQEKAQLRREFANVIFSMKKGELLAEPFRSPSGWHVIRLEDILEAKRPAFEDVREKIIEILRGRQSANVLEDLMKELKPKSKIIIHEDRLETLAEP